MLDEQNSSVRNKTLRSHLRVAFDASGPSKQAPHNLEAEQALLGAVLVNNEAMDRVSSFLEPHHFFDPLHQQIYETAAKLIAVGKVATPITLKTFFDNSEPSVGGLTVAQYLGTLAANATTIINAEDYGRTVYDLARRRAIVLIAEDLAAAAASPSVYEPLDRPVSLAKSRLDEVANRQADAKPDEEGLEFADDELAIEGSPFLIKGLIAECSTNAVYGKSTAGKTFFGLDMAFHIALGKAYCGHRVRRAPVLYIGLEGQPGLRVRVKAQIAQHGRGAWFARLLLPVSLGAAAANIAHEDLIIRKADALKAKFGQPVGVILIDTYSAAIAGDDENDAATVAAFMARCERIKATTGAAILFTAHPGKNSNLGVRGSSALQPSLDALIHIDREDGAALRTVTLKKVKDGVEGVWGSFTLKHLELGTDAEGDPITSCVVEHGHAAPKKATRPKPESPPGRALEELNQLLLNYRHRAIADERIPDGARCVDLEEWRERCRVRGLTESREPEAQKKAFQRASRDLRDAGLLGMHDGWVWPIPVDPAGTCADLHESEGDINGLSDDGATGH